MNKSKLVLLALSVLTLSGCTEANRAESVLSNQGFTNIKTGGYAWFSCGRDDTYATKFTATGLNGLPVQGAVCSGFFMKGATVRFE